MKGIYVISQADMALSVKHIIGSISKILFMLVMSEGNFLATESVTSTAHHEPGQKFQLRSIKNRWFQNSMRCPCETSNMMSNNQEASVEIKKTSMEDDTNLMTTWGL